MTSSSNRYSRQYLLPLEQIFYRKQSLGAPDPPLALLTAMFFRVWKEGPHTVFPLFSATIPRDSRIPNFCHLHPENRFFPSIASRVKILVNLASRVAVKSRIFCVFPNPARLFFGQFPDPDNAFPGPGFASDW